jgi:hypothetical protein
MMWHKKLAKCQRKVWKFSLIRSYSMGLQMLLYHFVSVVL